MKTLPSSRLLILCSACFLAFSINTYADTFSGKVSDLDAGNGYLTVTNPDNETTKTFRVTANTAITTADGKTKQLLDLIEGTLVTLDIDPGDGRVATKITVLPSVQEPP